MEQQYTRITTSLFEAIQKVTSGVSEQKQEVLSEKVESINKETESIDEWKKPWSPEPAKSPPNPKDAEHKKASMLIDKIRSLRQLGVEAKEKGDHDKHKEYHERAKQADQEYQKLGHKSLMNSPLRSESVDEAMTPEFEKKFSETPKGVEVHMKHKETGKIVKNKFIGTHSAVAAAKKHIADMEKQGYEVHAKKLIEQEEQIDELKTSTLISYHSKSQKSAAELGNKASKEMDAGNMNKASALLKQVSKRQKSQSQAMGKIQNRYANLKDEVEQTDEAVTDYNPKSQGGTRKELLAKFAETGNSKHAEAARKAGASHEELKKAQMTAMKRGVGKKGSNYLLSKNEEVEQTDEAMSHQAATTLKHIKPGTLRQNYGDKQDAANIKPGIKGVADRLAMLDRAKKEGRLKEEEEQFDETIIKEDLNIEAPEQFTFKDYLTAVTSLVGSELEEHQIVAVAYEAFRTQEEDIILEELTRDDLKQKMKAHMDAGHQISGEKFSMKDGKPYGEYVVTDKETGVRRKYIHHGSTRRVENMGSRTKKDAKAND